MDNYLSHRWPEQPPPESWTPERSASPRRRRRVARNLAVAALLLLLTAGIFAGGWYLVHTAVERLTRNAEVSAPPSDELASPSPAASPTPSSALPRAEHGLGVRLELDDSPAEPLSAHEIYELVLPSVVSITAMGADGGGSGSGVIMREDGYILTNYHVIDGAGKAVVMTLPGGDSYPAGLVGYDQELDVAVLKIDATGLTAARFGDSDALRVGDAAYAIGNPMGYLYGTMTNGIISYLDREQTVDNTSMTLIQTTALLNSGNSGGALVNEFGQVVGITVAKISGPSSASAPQVEGLGFAIPISLVRPFIDRILDAGESWRPAMGILCYAGTLDGLDGIIVDSANPGGPAEQAGFIKADMILSANGKRVESLYALKRVLNDAGVGGEVTFDVLRDGKQITLTLTLADSADLPES